MPAPRLHPLPRLLICILGAVVVQILAVSVVMAAHVLTARINGQPSDISEVADRYALALTVLAYPPTLMWLWICRRGLDRRSVASLGLRAPSIGTLLSNLCGGLAAGAGAIALWFGVMVLSGQLEVRGWAPESFEKGLALSLGMLLIYAGAFAVVGFMEEILFRGYGLHNLTSWLGWRAALVLQAIVFALIHLGNLVGPALRQSAAAHAAPTFNTLAQAAWETRGGLVNIALIGVFFGLAYLKTGSLWFPIGFHAAWNFCLGCIFSLPVSGIPVFRLLDVGLSGTAATTGGSFGPEGSLFMLFIYVPLLFLLFRQPDHPQALLDLASLKRITPILAEPEPGPSPMRGLAEAHRFRTTMRSSEQELDAVTLEALKSLSNRPAAPVSPSLFVLPAPGTPVQPSPAPAPGPPAQPRPVVQQPAAVGGNVEQPPPVEVEAPPQTEPAPPPAKPATQAPAPRW